jgi:hypothetical protein
VSTCDKRTLADVKKRCENGEYPDPMEAESAFREFVDNERACQKAKASDKILANSDC